MGGNDVTKLVEYWVKTAEHDYDTAISLFHGRRYPDCLFYGHLVLEKILKAISVLKAKKHPKPIHNLLVLLEDSGISSELTKEEIEFLAEVNRFNIKARYPDYKLSFYKLCTLAYVKPRLERITDIYKKLCGIIKR